MGGSIVYPPSDGKLVIQRCAALKNAAINQKDIIYPYWFAVLGVAKYTIQNNKLAHALSCKHPEYDKDECQKKIDEWKTGPATCEEFSKHFNGCAECRYRGKIKSPIVLGYNEDIPTVTPATDVGLPKGFRWTEDYKLQKYYENEDGVGSWRTFCNTVFYPIKRIRSEDGTWALLINAREKNGDWRIFSVQMMDLASTDTLAKAFAKYEVFMEGKNSRQYAQEMLLRYVSMLQENRVEVRTYSAFGWDEEGGFVLGNKRITSKGIEDVLLSDTILSTMNCDFGVSGTTRAWVDLVDYLLNRPKAEPFQFILMAIFGAPLIELVNPFYPDWHGIPVALYGKSGLGKTTMSQALCGVFGDPRKFKFNTSNLGTTANARIQTIATMRNLPFVMDEITAVGPRELADLGYAMSNGRDKMRLNKAGKPITDGKTWATIPIVTSNESPMEELSKLANQLVDPTQLRYFEIKLSDNYIDEVYEDRTQSWEAITELMENYGYVGRKYLQYVVEHKEQIISLFKRVRAQFAAKTQDEGKERFYTNLVVTAIVGGTIAAKLGFIRYDISKTARWAFNHIKKLRDTRRATLIDGETYISLFLSSLNGRLIVTKRLGDARSYAESLLVEPKFEVVGRMCVEDKKLYVSQAYLREWCSQRNVPLSMMREELDRHNLLVYDATNSPSRRLYIGQGTNIVTGRTTCYEFNYDQVMRGMQLIKPMVEQKEAGNG